MFQPAFAAAPVPAAAAVVAARYHQQRVPASSHAPAPADCWDLLVVLVAPSQAQLPEHLSYPWVARCFEKAVVRAAVGRLQEVKMLYQV